MNSHEINPFQELYVTDSADPSVFVRLFSDFPVKHAQPLFRDGNVVIKGTQGSGKSMLLNLFQPRIRVAYFEAGKEFPVPRELSSFVSGGINLRHCGALNIGQRHLGVADHESETQFPLYFADFLNYYIVRDVFESVQVMVRNPSPFNNLARTDQLDHFAQALSEDACWLGGIPKCGTFEELCQCLDERLQGYLRFHNYNGELPEFIHDSKTTIGDPIAKTAEYLQATEVVPQKTPLFVLIDQIESLHRSDTTSPTLGLEYRRIVNKAIGMRDLRVSYRVGTRQYAWEDDLKIYGREDELENIRDFRIVDLDDMLRRKENTKTWIFPKFAEDAFARRLRHAKFDIGNRRNPIAWVFGPKVAPTDEAKRYCRNSPVARILRLDSEWPADWRAFLEALFEIDPMEATLAAAWARQSGGGSRRVKRMEKPPPDSERPWLKIYWKKERIRQCLMQIASRSYQRLNWAGKEQVLALSSGNISIFLSICHDIWEAFLRSERGKPQASRLDPVRSKEPIDPNVQAMGIRAASDIWYEKISVPYGDDRQAFISVLGKEFREWLLADVAMSNPGQNGFSLLEDDLRQHPALARFLEDLVRHGDLHEAPHTTKNEDRRKRKKWYLSPILSPHFQIPESHIKEPRYINDISVVARWLRDAKIVRGDLQDILSLVTSSQSSESVEDDHSLQEHFDFMEDSTE